MQLHKLIEVTLASILVGCSGTQPAVESVKPKSPRMDRSKMLVGAICLAQEWRDDAHVKDIADAGLDFLYGIPATDRKTLDLFAKYGVGVIATGAVPFWHGMNGEWAGQLRTKYPLAKYEECLNKFEDHPAIWMVDFVDEPSADDYEAIGEVTALMNAKLPATPAYINLYPNYARASDTVKTQRNSQLGTTNYLEYVKKYVEKVPTDYMSIDYYMYGKKPSSLKWLYAKFYENMSAIADACRDSGKSFWYMAQVNSPDPKYVPSVNNLRFQAFAGMAYGAEMIEWACWGFNGKGETLDMPGLCGWWHNNALDTKGNRSEQYAKIKQVNREIHTLGVPFMKYRRTDTKLVKGAYSNGFFKDVKANDKDDILIGEMVSRKLGENSQALFIVAADDPWDKAPRSREISFKASGTIEAYGVNGKIMVIKGANDRYFVKIGSNEAVMITRTVKSSTNFDHTKFMIHACYLRPETAENIRWSKECGIDFFWDVPEKSSTTFEALAKQNQGAITIGSGTRWCGGNGSNAGKMKTRMPMTNFIKRCEGHKTLNRPGMWYFDVADEPNAKDMAHIGEVCDYLFDHLDNVEPYVNLYPNYAQLESTASKKSFSQLGTKTYDEYLDEYGRTSPLNFICYDFYPIHKNEKKQAGAIEKFYNNFDSAVKLTRRSGRIFWLMAQANSHTSDHDYFTSVDQMRYQAYAAMTFGAENVGWACYGKGWWTNNVVSLSGVKGPQYAKVSAVNRELHGFGPKFMQYRNVNTHYVGFANRGALKVLDAGYVRELKAKDGSQLLVGEMVSRKGVDSERAFLVLPTTDIRSEVKPIRTITFKLTADRKVRVVSPEKGEFKINCDANGEYCFDLADCHAALIEVL